MGRRRLSDDRRRLRRLWFAAILLCAIGGAVAARPAMLGRAGIAATAAELPEHLTDQQFWTLSSSFSEPGGTFHSDNFVSNEGRFQTVIPDLLRRVKPGGFYVGVGPEQNFTYIAAVRPRMAFIVDIRRGNLQEHLLYKALMELSADRADFLARLFSRERPSLPRGASVEALFAAIEGVPASETRYRRTLNDVLERLATGRRLPLTAEDRAGIEYVYRTAFFADGPDLNYRLTGQGPRGFGGRGMGTPTYADLMAMDDGAGEQRSYLATEANFAFVKDLQMRNLIVPVVGDFAGSKALRSVGQYARQHGATVDAFYLSNVEQYLRQDGKWTAFCANVAAMPTTASSTFVRTVRGGGGRGGAMFTSSLAGIQAETHGCAVPSR
ncbi:MAG: hypothetical protein IT184_11250 [Acidobacteria bacterium]|nr:hypothetical protein [Acidobacteriota bacterium]